MAIALSLLVALLAASPREGGFFPLSPVADVPLPGYASRFDYQWVDPVNRRLYVAHLGDSSLVVFDLDGQRVITEIKGLPSVHGVVAAPEQHLVFATATAQKSLAVIDDRTFEVRARIPAGEYPNGLAYDPKSGRVFVSNNAGVGVAVIDVTSVRALPGIDIGGGAGNTSYDAESGQVLAAVHGLPVLADIDPFTARVASRLPLHGVKTCHGLLVAPGLRLAFAACGGDGPALVVFDLRAGRQLQTLPLTAYADVLAFDPGLQRLYAASSTGTVSVFAVATDRSVTEMGHAFVGPNAHTVAVDPATHRAYFPLESLQGKPVLRIMDARCAP